MFGIGMSEMLVIMVIGLVVIGPKQLPEVARTLGKLFAQFKRTTNDLKEQVDREVRQFTEMEEVQEFKRSMEAELNGVKSHAEEFVKTQMEEAEKAEAELTKEFDEAKKLANPENLFADNANLAGPNNGDAGMMSSDTAPAPDATPSATANSVEFSSTHGKDEGLPPGKLPS